MFRNTVHPRPWTCHPRLDYGTRKVDGAWFTDLRKALDGNDLVRLLG